MLVEAGLSHNPYFNRWFSAITKKEKRQPAKKVTILILIDGFLQSDVYCGVNGHTEGHNPYFNRWFSAICKYRLERNYIRVSQSLF